VRIKLPRLCPSMPDATEVPLWDAALQPTSKPGRHEPAIVRRSLHWDQRPMAPLEREHARVDRGRWIEDVAWEPARQPARVPSAPQDSVECARPGNRALDGDAPLDDHIGTLQRHSGIVEQMPKDRGRPMEGKVGDNAEGLARKRNRSRIVLTNFHIREALPEELGPVRVELNGHYAVRQSCKLRSQATGSRPQVEDDVVRSHLDVADDLRRERPRANEVLARCAAGSTRTTCASLGHGPSPCSS
jgi:hypothetical protein